MRFSERVFKNLESRELSFESAEKVDVYAAMCIAINEESYSKRQNKTDERRACYFSAEFLIGRLFHSNLLNLGLVQDAENLIAKRGWKLSDFEDFEDAALGNGGLGRLAACFLDSAASMNISLDGYGIRYKFGLFKQSFENGFQNEAPDVWQHSDFFSVRREKEKQTVNFNGQSVYAVPYDIPVIGYDGKKTNNLRLWQAEPVDEINFDSFNNGDIRTAFEEKNNAEQISAFLYPNDNSKKGKILRLKQEYFFSSASLKDIIRKGKMSGVSINNLYSNYAIQLNDTHPAVAIPEFIRLATEEGCDFSTALESAKKLFAYTNHTIMIEALEKWDIRLFKKTLPDVYKIIKLINSRLIDDLKKATLTDTEKQNCLIINNGYIVMANLAVYVSKAVNGVAEIHTEILKTQTLKHWHKMYPELLQNKTNGITQRRWLALNNPELSELINKKIGKDWITKLTELEKLKTYIKDDNFISDFIEIKRLKKQQLADYIYENENIRLSPHFVFDIQIKRMHEYKRQLLNAFSILYIYYELKEGRLNNFVPTAFIFGAKAAPGYARAKGVIKYINEIAKLVNNDSDVKDKIKVVFITNYNVSYAEKLVAAADISEQISTAGTEASGTGNMKLMLNGAVTLGTMDGANIEIFRSAGIENNYCFGARVENLKKINASYNPIKVLEENKKLKRIADTLIDNTFSDNGTGLFTELYNSLTKGASWHSADNYLLFYDFNDYIQTKLKAISDTSDKLSFARKCLNNIAGSGIFSSDRTILQYAKEIWDL